MRAIGLTELGGPEVLKVVDLPEVAVVGRSHDIGAHVRLVLDFSAPL
jgi:hypothetical protein